MKVDLSISNVLIKWYLVNKRDLPWRATSDPYIIWLSEIILQQTRVNQGMPYFYKFSEEFPTVNSLAEAPLDKVLKLWQGLGYYSRARNMHTTAKFIVDHFDGKFPHSYDEILKLRGVGEYTAAAIASLAFDIPKAVVDGNVIRVISRLYGITEPVDKIKTGKEIKDIAQTLLDPSKPGLHNQAMMEFGSLQCTPVNPDCSACVLKSRCRAYSQEIVERIPFKEGKTKIRNRYFHYLVIRSKDGIYLHQRSQKDIWKGLFEFPLIEWDKELNLEELMQTMEWKSIFRNLPLTIKKISDSYSHVLSHQKLLACFVEVEISSDKTVLNDAWQLVTNNLLHEYAVPRLVDRYLKDSGLITS